MKKKAKRQEIPKPVVPSRIEVFARDHDHLSTYELNCRIGGLRDTERAASEDVARLSAERAKRAVVAKDARESADALEALVERRR